MLFNQIQSIPQQILQNNTNVGFALPSDSPCAYLYALLSSVSQAKDTQGVEEAENRIRIFFEK
jgi:hypothetical protein